MFSRRQLKSSLKMKKSVIILTFVLVLSQLGNSSSIIDNVPANIEENELADVNAHNKINLEDDTERNKKTVVLLVPVESSEENDDFQDESEEGENEEEDEENEDAGEIPHHSHKTKRCKSPSSFRKVRRLPTLKNSQKYISASTESSIGESLESPISGKSLFRVASVKDAKKILKNLLKSQPSKREGNGASEIVSMPNKDNNRPKKYICYCVEEDCDMKKPSRPNVVKKRIGPNAFSKSIYSTNYENQEDSSRFLGSEHILGAPHNLQCPAGFVLMEEPEYLGQSPTKQPKKRRPVKKCPQPILLCDSDSYSLGQPTKIRLPLAGNKKWNRRVYKVDKKSPLAQKVQSTLEKKEAEDGEPCTEPESTFNDAQNVQDYYNNEQSNVNQYHQIQIDPNLVYPGPYVVYPHYSQHPQYGDGLYNPIPMEPADQGLVSHQEPSLPQYGPSQFGEDDIINSFSLEPANQGFVRHEEPSHDQYVPTQLGGDHLYIPIHLEPKNHGFVGNQVPSPNQYELTPLGRNFVDLDQCIKLFGPNFCIVTTTTISSIHGSQYANNCDDKLKNPGIAPQWKDKTQSSRYPANSNKARTHFYGLGATQKDEENVHKSGEYPENRYEPLEDRIPLRSGFYYVTTPPYSSRPLNLRFPTSDGILKTATPNYETIGSKHEKESHDFEDYENSVDPIEDSRESESDDYSVKSDSDFNEVIQKRPLESITEIPVTAIRQNLQGAHRISSPRYFEYTVKPGEGDTNNFSNKNSEGSSEHSSKFIQSAQYSNLPNYDRSEVPHWTNKPRNEETNESATPCSVILKTGIPEDDSRNTLRMGIQNGRKFPNLQRVPTVYPIYDNKDHTTSTSLKVHPSHRYNDNTLSSNYGVYHSTVPDEADVNFQPHIPKTMNSQQQFVGITQTTPVDHYSKPVFVSSASIDSKNYYTTMKNLGHSTMSLLGKNQPEEHTYASERIVEDNTEKVPMITTQSRLAQPAFNKYFTAKTHSYHQSKQPKTNFESGIAKPTKSHRNFIGRTQSIPVNKFSKPGIVSGATVGGNDRCATSYASMVDLRYPTSPSLRANEPEKRIYSTTIYPTMNAKETLHDIPEYEEIGTEEARSQIESADKRKYFTTPRTLYPQLVGSHQSTLVDGSTQPSQVGANLETRKMNSPFVESLTQSPLNNFAKSGTTFDAGTSYASMEDLRYNTPLLGVNEPEERDEYGFKQIPSSLHYSTPSQIPNTKQNKRPKPGKVTSPQCQFVGVAQSTPQNEFSQPGIASIETMGGNSHYTTSYATMEDTGPTTTSILRANEPEEGIFRSSSYPRIHGDVELKTASSWTQENEKQHGNNIEETAWTQYYPTQSGIQDQHFTTDRNYYPQFVGSHKSTNCVCSSTDLYPKRYFTTDKSSYPQFDSQTPEDVMNSYNRGQSRNWHYSTIQQVTSGQNAHGQFVASHRSTPGEIVSSTTGSNLVRMPATDLSKTYWPSTTERSERQYFPTPSKRPFAIDNRRSTTEQDNLGMKISSEGDYSNEDIRNRYTSTASILDSGRSNPSGASNELFGPSEDMDSKMPGKTLGNSFKQSGATPNVEFDSSIKEESNAFTSMSYDNNVDRVTGPDSYFESGGLKNWNDFTSMSSDDFTIGDINRAEGIKQPKIIDGMKSEEEELQTTEVTPRHTTYYEVVGEELPHKERTINEESHPDDSNNPISETHYFKSHSTSPQILESENNVLDKHSTENLNSEENDEQNPETTTVVGNTNAFDYDDGNDYSSVESNNLTSMKKIEGKDSSAVSSTEGDSIHTDKSSDIKEAMMQHQSESSEKVQLPFSNDKITQPGDITQIPNPNQPLENDYTNDYSSMEKIPQTELAKNHDDYMSSEAYLPSKKNESVGAPFSKTASNMLESSTTVRSVNYDDYGNFDEPHKIALQPKYIEKHPAPTFDSSTHGISSVNQHCPENRNIIGSVKKGDYRDFGELQKIAWQPNYNQQRPASTVDMTHEISNMNQLLNEEKYILKTAAELAVNELVSPSPGKLNANCRVSPDAVGAPNQGLLPGLQELPILKNLFSFPEVRDMAIHTIKGLLSDISGVPPESSLGRLSDHLINSVLNGVINNVLPGPVTTPSSGMVDEHRLENGQWTVVHVPLVPNNDQVGMGHDGPIFNIMENIIRRIGIKGARSPAVQNIIVQTVENILNKAKYIADHSVLWDVLDKVITRAGEPGTSFRNTPEIVNPINKVPDIRKPGRLPFRKPPGIVKPINKIPDIKKPGGTPFRKPPGIVKPINKVPDIKKSGGTFKTLPVIPIVEHVVKNGEWSEKQTILGEKRKNFDLPTDNQDHSSMHNYKTAHPANQLDYNTKPADYAFMGDSEEDAEITQENYNPNDIVEMTEEEPTTVKQNHDNDEENLENSPIKYYSRNDRILSYIKNHQNPPVIGGTQWSNELGSTTDDSVEFAQPTQPDYDRLSSGSEESSVGSPKKKICTCKEVEEKVNGERVASGLRESQVSTDDDNHSKLPSNIHNLDENDESATESFVGKENSLTTLKSHENSGEKLDSTESSVASSTIHHLDVNDEGSNDYTTEEYVANQNPSATKEIDQNSEEEEASIEMTESNESSHSSTVYVYGVPVGNTQIPKDKSGSGEKTDESTNKEYISASNALTTEKIDENSEEVGNEMTENKESHGFSDVPEEILEAGNHRQTDQSISTPVFVYDAPVGNTQFPESTSRSKEQSEESTNKEYIGATNVLTESNESHGFSDVPEEILEAGNHRQTDQTISTPVFVYDAPVGNTQFPESTSRSKEQSEESTNKEYIGATNVLTTETFDQDSKEVTNEMTESNESHGFSDVPEEILEAGNHRQPAQSISTPVYVYDAPVGNTQLPESTSRSKEQSEESTNKEYIGATNVLTTETFDQDSKEVANEMTDSNELHGFSDVPEEILEAGNHRQPAQSISTPVYVYDAPVGNTQFPESTSRSKEESEESTNKEYIGATNVLTTETFDQDSKEVTNEMKESNESHGFSDVPEEILEAGNHRQTDQSILEAENDRPIDPSISTPVYVYGVPILEKNLLGNTNLDESTTENLRHQFVEALNPHDTTHHATTSISTKPEGIIGNTQFPGFQSTESNLNQEFQGPSEESTTEEYIKQANAFTTDSEDNSDIETSIESTENRESFSDVTSEILLAGSKKNTDDNDSTRVYVNGVSDEESTAQGLTKISKDYGSPQEASTSSQGLIGAARSRTENPRQRLDRPRDKILKQSQISSGSSSKCVTPKYDPTYFGKISLNGVNPGGDSISDLTNTDLFYVGDGVKLPLTIKRMPDGSFALTISEKICENFVKRKCPCCVPREGDIIEEKRQSDEAEDDEYIAETTSQENYNYDSVEPTESTEFQGKSKRRFARSTSGSEVVVTSATPVEKFVKKYNLTLSLDDNTPLVNQRNNDGDRVKNTKRKNRLSSSKDTRIRNLFENNNEIQRDDSKETEKRAIDYDYLNTDLKESNSIRKAEYTYDTGTNDFFQSLLHIKDVPEEKRTEIVLNALDRLVNSASEKIRMDHFGNSVEEDLWEDDDQWEGSEEYDLNDMENEMAKYGYQKDNPILERIRFIKAQQDSHGQYKYQKNIDHRARGKMNMLKTVLHWLRELFLETKSNKPS